MYVGLDAYQNMLPFIFRVFFQPIPPFNFLIQKVIAGVSQLRSNSPSRPDVPDCKEHSGIGEDGRQLRIQPEARRNLVVTGDPTPRDNYKRIEASLLS